MELQVGAKVDTIRFFFLFDRGINSNYDVCTCLSACIIKKFMMEVFLSEKSETGGLPSRGIF